MYEEPPIVDIDEILDEQNEADARATRTQVALVALGSIVGVAGLLAVLVVTAPTWIQLVRIVAALTSPDGARP
jgi:hypothetical protein